MTMTATRSPDCRIECLCHSANAGCCVFCAGATGPPLLPLFLVLQRAATLVWGYGDPVYAVMADAERADERPRCNYPLDNGKCGSEDGLFKVKGNGRWTGRQRETPVCRKHLNDAWRTWTVDSAEPMGDVASKR